ncbi:Mu transposase C-terminal domain-containing protein [Caloranaerobacter sp. DY30410]|uniref:Mu transposase C-terminal domain-containing protein n=1 Tax=Caloranaerobacter sp. DY30410 TaxID=3238305 RepID=UPI003D057EBF
MTKVVTTIGITYKAKYFFDAKLIPYIGHKVVIKPLDHETIEVYKGNQFICYAKSC